MTAEEAIAIHDSGKWKKWTNEQRARFQMHEPRLCMPFGIFHEACEAYTGREIQTVEFASGLNAHLKVQIPPLPADVVANLLED